MEGRRSFWWGLMWYEFDALRPLAPLEPLKIYRVPSLQVFKTRALMSEITSQEGSLAVDSECKRPTIRN